MFCSGQVYTPDSTVRLWIQSRPSHLTSFHILVRKRQWHENFEKTSNTFEVGISACLASDVTLLLLEEHRGTHSSIRILHWHVWLTHLVAGSSPGCFSSLRDGVVRLLRTIVTWTLGSSLPRWVETTVRLQGPGLALRPAQQFRGAPLISCVGPQKLRAHETWTIRLLTPGPSMLVSAPKTPENEQHGAAMVCSRHLPKSTLVSSSTTVRNLSPQPC